MSNQRKLRDLPKGLYRTQSGHIRFSGPKELRGQYQHRKIIEDLVEQTPYSVKLLLPCPYEVHHMDYNKQNQDPSNLLMVSESLHSVMTADRHKAYNGQFRPKWKKPPSWLPLFDDDEIPF